MSSNQLRRKATEVAIEMSLGVSRPNAQQLRRKATEVAIEMSLGASRGPNAQQLRNQAAKIAAARMSSSPNLEEGNKAGNEKEKSKGKENHTKKETNTVFHRFFKLFKVFPILSYHHCTGTTKIKNIPDKKYPRALGPGPQRALRAWAQGA